MHGITTINKNGQQFAEAMYANKPAWHGLGQVFDPNGTTAPKKSDVLPLIDWGVSREPVKLASTNVVIPKTNALVREDTREVLGIVGERYRVKQNTECLDFVDSLVADHEMTYEAVFSLHGGKKVVFLARMPQVDKIANGDVTMRYVSFVNTHDGMSSLQIYPTAIRVVCANMLAVSLSEERKMNLGIKIRHSSQLETQLMDAKTKLSKVNERFLTVAEQSQLLAQKSVSPQMAIDFVNTLYPEPTKDSSKMAVTLHKKRYDEMKRIFNKDTNQIDSIKGTWWQMYNMVSEYIDHGSSYNGDVQTRKEARFYSTAINTGAMKKVEAFNLALSMAT